MTTNQVQNYVDAQVKQLNDRTVAPLVAAINEELAGQARNNERLAAVQAEVSKHNKESDARISELQIALGKANQASNALATKLAEATASAANDGQE